MLVIFLVNGSYCFSAGQDRIVRLWNPHKALFMKEYTGHGYEIFDIDVYVFADDCALSYSFLALWITRSLQRPEPISLCIFGMLKLELLFGDFVLIPAYKQYNIVMIC